MYFILVYLVSIKNEMFEYHALISILPFWLANLFSFRDQVWYNTPQQNFTIWYKLDVLMSFGTRLIMQITEVYI